MDSDTVRIGNNDAGPVARYFQKALHGRFIRSGHFIDNKFSSATS